MNENDHFDKIEAYLNGEMAPDERGRFEAQMLADAALAAEVDAHKATRLATRRLQEQRLQANLKSMLAEMDGEHTAEQANNNPTGNSTFFKWTSLVLALALCATLWSLFKHTPNEQPSLREAYIDSLTTEFKAIKTALDSVVNLKNRPGSAEDPDAILQEIKQLQLKLDEKDRQIRLLERERNRPLGPREIAQAGSPIKKFGGRAATKNTSGQAGEKSYEAAAAAFDQGRFAEVERLLFPAGSPFALRADSLVFSDLRQLNTDQLELTGYTFLMLDQVPRAIQCFKVQKQLDGFKRDEADWSIFRCQITQPGRYRTEIAEYIKKVQTASSHPRKKELDLLLELYRANGIQL